MNFDCELLEKKLNNISSMEFKDININNNFINNNSNNNINITYNDIAWIYLLIVIGGFNFDMLIKNKIKLSEYDVD